ncbi:hypothetical protein PsYK624_042560 [Phanerochaete sordida]|uniref:Uncharacterized protein n=1 Tax=Phanerochaete sordida TaxID=48140 RepID=A0A9P3G330_9APHY|nr:hypothetical protein PsYK624_042560 [Phanerochaete sordida]
METYPTVSLNSGTHFVREGSSIDCMSQPLLSQDLPDHTFLDNWSCREDTYPTYSDQILLQPLSFSPLFFEDEVEPPCPPPQRPHQCSRSDSYLPSPPRTGTPFKPSSLPGVCPSSCMDSSDRNAPCCRQSLSRLLTGSHDVSRHSQPPSPPLDTPELVQRCLPDARQPEPLSPPLTSPVDMLDLPQLTTFDSFERDPSDRGSLRSRDGYPEFAVGSSTGQQGCWSGDDHSNATLLHPGHITTQSPIQELLTPDTPSWDNGVMLFDDSAMDWSGTNGGAHSFMHDLSPPPLSEAKPRTNSLDSARQDSYDFMDAMHRSSLRPLRSFTVPSNLPSRQPSPSRLEPLWEELHDPHRMDIDDEHLLKSPRSPSLNLNVFDDSDSALLDAAGCDPFSSSTLLSHSPRPPPLTLFDETPFDGATCGFLADDFVPSSPRSPHMQLLPTGDDDMVTDPLPVDTISPSLLGLPEQEQAPGLGLDVDPGLDRSPSPSDYELHLLDGQLDIPLQDLPEDEYQQLRAYYDCLTQAEAEAKEREAVLDRRVKDVCALLKPPRAVDDAAVMRARRQEYRSATDLRAEARRVRKEEKHRLRELGSLLDLKLETRVFNTRSSLRSVAHLVADMVFKRRDRTRSLANRRAAGAPWTLPPSPLRCSFSAEDLRSGIDFDSY